MRPLSCLASAMFCSLAGHIYIYSLPSTSIRHTQLSTVSNMNPPKYSYLFLVFFLCFRLNFGHKVLDDGNQFLEDIEKEKQDNFGSMINPAKFGAGMGMQFHEDIEKEKQDHFGNMIFPSKFGDGMGMPFHEDLEKEKQDHISNMINPSKFGAGMGMQFHEDIEKEKQDHFGNEINPTRGGGGRGVQFYKNNAIEKQEQDQFGNTVKPKGGGAGMGMAYGWTNPPCQQPYPGVPIGPEPILPSPQVPIIGPPCTCCPCTVRCCNQYKMKLGQLRKTKRLRINELQNRKTGDDKAQGGGIDESFGSLGQLYP